MSVGREKVLNISQSCILKCRQKAVLYIVFLLEKEPLTLKILSKESTRKSEWKSADKPTISLYLTKNLGLCICKY